jgi:hypothetical protein
LNGGGVKYLPICTASLYLFQFNMSRTCHRKSTPRIFLLNLSIWAILRPVKFAFFRREYHAVCNGVCTAVCRTCATPVHAVCIGMCRRRVQPGGGEGGCEKSESRAACSGVCIATCRTRARCVHQRVQTPRAVPPPGEAPQFLSRCGGVRLSYALRISKRKIYKLGISKYL